MSAGRPARPTRPWPEHRSRPGPSGRHDRDYSPFWGRTRPLSSSRSRILEGHHTGMGANSNDSVTLSWSCRRPCLMVAEIETGEWIMATVIDIDSHFEPGDDWLLPYPKLAARLPKLEPAKLAVDTIVGDLLHDVPMDKRPP